VIADPASLTVLVNHAIFKRRDYNGSEIAMLLWAVDKLELPIMTELTAAMTSRIVEAKDSFSARNIAMTLTTLAKDGTPMDTAVSAALVKRAVTIRATFDEQAIASTLWALASSGSPMDAVLVDALVEQATKKMESFSAPGIARLLWALHVAGVLSREKRLVDSLVQRSIDIHDRFNPFDIATLFSALAQCSHPVDKDLGVVISAHSVKRAKGFVASDIAAFLSSLVTLDMPLEPTLVAALTNRALRNLRSLPIHASLLTCVVPSCFPALCSLCLS
jgi:hypothetical protein